MVVVVAVAVVVDVAVAVAMAAAVAVVVVVAVAEVVDVWRGRKEVEEMEEEVEEVGWAGLVWAGLGWAGLSWAELGWAGLGPTNGHMCWSTPPTRKLSIFSKKYLVFVWEVWEVFFTKKYTKVMECLSKMNKSLR